MYARSSHTHSYLVDARTAARPAQKEKGPEKESADMPEKEGRVVVSLVREKELQDISVRRRPPRHRSSSRRGVNFARERPLVWRDPLGLAAVRAAVV